MSPHDTVLHSALELFTHKGYFNTSMRDITRESRGSTGSIYHYFKDKAGVAAALYQSLMQRMQAELQQISQQHDSAEAKSVRAMSWLPPAPVWGKHTHDHFSAGWPAATTPQQLPGRSLGLLMAGSSGTGFALI